MVRGGGGWGEGIGGGGEWGGRGGEEKYSFKLLLENIRKYKKM